MPQADLSRRTEARAERSAGLLVATATIGDAATIRTEMAAIRQRLRDLDAEQASLKGRADVLVVDYVDDAAPVLARLVIASVDIATMTYTETALPLRLGAGFPGSSAPRLAARSSTSIVPVSMASAIAVMIGASAAITRFSPCRCAG